MSLIDELMPKVSIAEYWDAVNNSTGWCTTCKDFTRDCTEPDAEKYECPVCDENTVMGAEQAMIMMVIDIEEDEDD